MNKIRICLDAGHVGSRYNQSPVVKTYYESAAMWSLHLKLKTALEALPQVESAEVSHEKGTAMVTLSAAIDNKALKHTVEEQGYKVTSIKVPDSGCADGKA